MKYMTNYFFLRLFSKNRLISSLTFFILILCKLSFSFSILCHIFSWIKIRYIGLQIKLYLEMGHDFIVSCNLHTFRILN